LTYPAAPASTLAFVTTVHLALAVLRNHRRTGSGRVSSLAVVSVLFAGGPWLLPSGAGLVVGLVVHTVYFLLCTRLEPEPPATSATSGALRAGSGAPSTSGSAALRSSRPPAPKGFVETSVIAVMEEGKDIRTFRFARPAGFEFVAGQFLPIRLSIAGRDHVRCYSISSSPESRGHLEISVKRQGLVSTALHSTIKPGAVVFVKPPAGGFTYPSGDRPLLLLAGGIGITPLISMMRHGVQAEPNRSMTLLYSAPSAAALAFREEIKTLVRRSTHANAILAVTRGESAPDLYPGRIDDSLITTAMPNVREAVAMICGPKPMIDGMRTTLTGLGLPEDRIRFEAFEAAVAIAKRGSHAVEPADGAAHEVRCVPSGLAMQAAAGQTLLEAAESAGVCIDSLCRAGVCGTCRTRVVDGRVDCNSTALAESDRQDGYVLACVAHVQGDCVIEV
jgi:ferredoxin-NADP reductase